MQGRDTGSAGFRRAAAYVADRFRRANLKAVVGDSFYQEVPLHAVDFVAAQSTVTLIRPDGTAVPWRWLHDIMIYPQAGIPATFDAPLGFTGWETPAELVGGRILAALAPPRFVAGPRGYAQTPPAGYVGTLVIDSEEGPEPVRWPPFSTTTMTLADTPLPAQAPGTPSGFEVNPASADALFEGSPHRYSELRAMATRGQRLPSFWMATRLRGRVVLQTRDLASPNVVAMLPGSDPQLANEAVVVSAHLDGYGVGEPVDGDAIYNGAFDDAAYVATLIDFAEQLHQSGRRFKRSLIFCAFTGEERGLLGSQYFVKHLPAGPRIVANINLDALRPIFPLRILTVLGLDDSTLGDAARDVAGRQGLQVQADPEPERVLQRRSDQISFLRSGIPALAFVFGYKPGSPEEATYRRWYVARYHAPSDDVTQPWDPDAAERFNRFFADLVSTVADAPAAPTWKAGTSFGR
jgi:Peptidase family M28